ncbi:MAG: S-adenosyl-L-homocysteine hydrolase [Novosphingobium sp.]|nr:S-adenosyl-L-homocysteine hydrolase [Novosphingobium sp.]
MRKTTLAAAVLAATGIVATAPAQAQSCWGPQAIAAAKMRNLDIMLMVTALRCRKGPDNFQPDYYAFAAAHQAELNVANGVLRAQFTGGGTTAANRALDRMSTSIANSYGVGHPELGCGELRKVTRDLSTARTRGVLLAAADALVGAPAIPGGQCAMRVATVRR